MKTIFSALAATFLLATGPLVFAVPPPPPSRGFPGEPPPGMPGGPGGGSSSRSSSSTRLSGAYTLSSGGTKTAKNDVYTATETDQSAILNGVFATGDGSSITLAKTKITASGAAAHGIMTSAKGAMEATDLDVSTSGVRAAAIATDRGGGTITVKGGRYHTSGTTSPAIYSTGEITVSDADLLAADSEAAVVEGKNSIVLANTVLSGARKCGVMIYQSFSGDAEGRRGTFTMNGGSLAAAEGPLFYVTNSTGLINLSGVTLSAPSGTLVQAASGRWGRTGSNGGKAVLTADAQTLNGDLAADEHNTVSLTLKNQSSLTGALRSAALVLDATSRWTITAASVLTTLAAADSGADPTAVLGNIRSYGYVVTYDDSRTENRWLGGKTYPLTGGGRLTPATTSSP